MENSINAKLEEIFKKWYDKIRKTEGNESIYDDYYSENNEKKQPFTKDGIMFNENIPADKMEDMWKLSSRRILFLLKDQYQDGNPKWFEDIRDWLRVTEFDRDTEHNEKSEQAIIRKEKNKNLQYPFIRKLAYLLWGLSKVNKDTVDDWPEGNVNKAFKDGRLKEFFNTQPFALVECKKLPGGPQLDDNVLIDNLKIDKYGGFLRQEIDTLKPNIIVCSGNRIFEFVAKYYSEIKDTNEPQTYGGKYELGDGTIVRNLTTCLKYYPGSKTVVINSYHPSAPVGWKYFEKVMSPFRAFIRKHPDF